MTLSPYQYELGGVVFGRNTEIPISKIDMQTYNVNAQDFQVIRSDENRFGIDSLAPAAIVFTMAVVENYPLEAMSGYGPPLPDDIFAAKGTIINQLAKVWKSKEVRAVWGAVMPLLCCQGDGTVLRIYGRPGKFQYTPRYNDNTNWLDVQAEFRRGDTYAHSDIEYYVGSTTVVLDGMPPNAAPVLAGRGPGDADSWVRVLIQGPATHPIVTYGDSTIELDLTVPAGVLLEISSYPWARRVVDSNGINWRAKLIGETKYLDQIQFFAGTEIPVSWTCTGFDPDSQLYFLWREAYNVV